MAQLIQAIESGKTDAIKAALKSALHGHLEISTPHSVDAILDVLATRLTPPEIKVEWSVEAAIKAIKDGKCVVVADGEDRENEADLVVAAEKVTEATIAFMVNSRCGLICCSIEGRRAEELKLKQMVAENTESHGTAFTISVDYKIGTTTGISAADRAATVRALSGANETREIIASDFARPGHMFPLRARDGGVLSRPGHTEASIDLARLAGLKPAGVICELMTERGPPMRPAEAKVFAMRNGLVYITIADLIAYRKAKS